MIHITIRPYHKRHITGLEADITIAFPDNRPPYRKRKKIPKEPDGSDKTKKKAEEWAMRTAVAIAKEGRPTKKKASAKVAPPVCPTLGEFALRYLQQHLIEGGLAKSTQRNRERDLDTYLLPLFKDTPLDQIDEGCFARLRSSLLKTKRGTPRCIKSRNKITAFLYQLLELSQEWRVFLWTLPQRPVPLKERKPIIEIYSDDERERLLKAAKENGTGPYLALLLGCEAGLRIGEIVGLNWTDIDVKKKYLLVRRKESFPGEVEPPKGGAERKVPLSDLLCEVLKTPYHTGERVIVKRDGSRAQCSTVRCWLEYAEKRAKLVKSLSVHKLRHTFASRLLATGASLKAVQILLGHASLHSTMCYLHLQPSEAEAAIRRLSGDMAEKPKEEEKP